MGLEYKQVPTDQVDNTGTPYEYAEVDENGVIQGYRRADGDWDIPIDLPEEELEVLTALAAEQNITLDALISGIIQDKIAETIKDASK